MLRDLAEDGAFFGAAAMLAHGPVEIVLTGDPADPRAAASAHAVALSPSSIVVWAHEAARDPEALLRGEEPVEGAPTVFVGRDHACRAPPTYPAAVRSELA